MSRNLSVSAPRLPVFNKKLQFVAQSGYSFTVPEGVKELYFTGVAAGGLGGQQSGSHTAYSGWNTSGSRNTTIGVSDNGAFILATDRTVATPSIIAIDPYSRRVQQITKISSGSSSVVAKPVIANNGVAVVVFGSGGYILTGPALQAPQSISPAGGSISASTASPFASVHPCEIDTPQSQVRMVFRHIGSNSAAIVYQGGQYVDEKVVTLYHANGQGANINGVRNVNGRHVLLSKNSAATPRLQIFHIDSSPATDASVAANWSRVTPAGDTTDITLYDIAYGNGVYVAVGQNCKIYTASSLDGPWTERSSGLASGGQLYGVKFFAGRFLAAGNDGTNAAVTTSVDGLNWTSTATGLGTGVFLESNIQYDSLNNRWTLFKNVSPGEYVYSSNGSTWTTVSYPTIRDVQACNAGCLFGDTYGVNLNTVTLTDTGDGGDLTVIKNGTKVLTLAGGKQLTSGGSSNGTLYPSGTGSGGSGGLTTTVPPTGTGGGGGTNYNGGGGSIPFTELLANSGSWGIKIPGASGGSPGTSGAGGGASILFGRYGGPGSGAHSVASYQAGGAGEGVVRHKIDVKSGDTITVSTGLGGYNSVQLLRSSDGMAIIEWEAV